MINYCLPRIRNNPRLAEEVEAAREELDSLNTLCVKCFNEVFKWQKGLLSRWRFTSLWGSMVSAAFCEFFKSTQDKFCKYIVQGDDIFAFRPNMLTQT